MAQILCSLYRNILDFTIYINGLRDLFFLPLKIANLKKDESGWKILSGAKTDFGRFGFRSFGKINPFEAKFISSNIALLTLKFVLGPFRCSKSVYDVLAGPWMKEITCCTKTILTCRSDVLRFTCVCVTMCHRHIRSNGRHPMQRRCTAIGQSC